MARLDIPRNNIEELLDDQELRVELSKKSFFHFITLYLNDSFVLPPAYFHKQMIDALDSVDDVNKYLAILGFRGSAKSTFLEAFAIWCMITGRNNLIVYIRATIDDAKASLANIRDEIETNDLLRADFGIELEDEKSHGFREKWSEGQLTIGNCTIIAKSRGQKVRGMKFKKARIDIIICDDIEDVKDADTAEKRKATRIWFFSEVLPATKQGVMADNIKVVMLGNLVHRDCLIKHLAKGDIVRVLEFSLIDKDGQITWPGLYPNMEAVEKEKQKVYLAGEGLGHIIWAREYLLKEVDAEDMILKRDEIQYYPDDWLQRKSLSAGVGVDFAISKEQTADFTAMVKGIEVVNDEGERRLLIMKNNVEQRMGFEETIKKAVEIEQIMPQGVRFYPEDVNYQKAAIEIMKKNGLNVVPQKATADKRARLISACFYIKTGRVLFPRTGAENLIDNIVGFGVEDHDDLADAFAYLVLGMIKKNGGILFG